MLAYRQKTEQKELKERAKETKKLEYGEEYESSVSETCDKNSNTEFYDTDQENSTYDDYG